MNCYYEDSFFLNQKIIFNAIGMQLAITALN